MHYAIIRQLCDAMVDAGFPWKRFVGDWQLCAAGQNPHWTGAKLRWKSTWMEPNRVEPSWECVVEMTDQPTYVGLAVGTSWTSWKQPSAPPCSCAKSCQMPHGLFLLTSRMSWKYWTRGPNTRDSSSILPMTTWAHSPQTHLLWKAQLSQINLLSCQALVDTGKLFRGGKYADTVPL